MLGVTEIGMDRLAAHEAELTWARSTEMREIEGMELTATWSRPRCREPGVIPFNVQGMSHYLTAAILSAEYGIGVRNGCFCAHPATLCVLAADPRRGGLELA